MFQMCGVFAEFERAIIRERINAGLARGRANGKQLGRPMVNADKETAIREALARGDKGIRRIARELGVGVCVVQRVRLLVGSPALEYLVPPYCGAWKGVSRSHADDEGGHIA